jgi:ribose-phosphate pyrophosphokinase
VESLRVFALTESRQYAERVAGALGVVLSRHEERAFEDGEHKCRPLESVRDADVYIVQSLYAEPGRSVNDKLCRLLFFIGALKDASARRVTAVMPYLCYSRKDRRSKPRDPVTTRYVAQLLEAAGVDRVVTMDVHNLAAYENAFRCGKDHLEARPLFVDYLAAELAGRATVVVSPDVGGVKRAEALRQTLSRRIGREANMAFLEKYRSQGVVSGEAVVGDVRGKVALIIDDLIASGGTLARAARACHAWPIRGRSRACVCRYRYRRPDDYRHRAADGVRTSRYRAVAAQSHRAGNRVAVCRDDPPLAQRRLGSGSCA